MKKPKKISTSGAEFRIDAAISKVQALPASQATAKAIKHLKAALAAITEGK